MNNYAESKKILDKTRDEYGCKGELIFRQALRYVMDYGASNLQDDWNYEHIKKDVNERHDNAEAEGKNLFIGRDFELALLDCARAIAQVEPYDIFVYVQKEVWLSHEGGIDYERVVNLLKGCMSNIEMWNDCQCALTLHELEDIGFDDDEIIELGFGYLLDVRKEEEDA